MTYTLHLGGGLTETMGAATLHDAEARALEMLRTADADSGWYRIDDEAGNEAGTVGYAAPGDED